jgi:hypothetical protein
MLTRGSLLHRTICLVFLSICLVLPRFCSPSCAQDATPPPGTLGRPGFGGTFPGNSPPPRIITGSQDTEILRHRDFAGKPCLAIGGFARAHTSNANLFDHVIEIKNGCSQSIRTQICYLRTQECITMEVAGHMTKEGILGTLPSIKDFRYEFRERF